MSSGRVASVFFSCFNVCDRKSKSPSPTCPTSPEGLLTLRSDYSHTCRIGVNRRETMRGAVLYSRAPDSLKSEIQRDGAKNDSADIYCCDVKRLAEELKKERVVQGMEMEGAFHSFASRLPKRCSFNLVRWPFAACHINPSQPKSTQTHLSSCDRESSQVQFSLPFAMPAL